MKAPPLVNVSINCRAVVEPLLRFLLFHFTLGPNPKRNAAGLSAAKRCHDCFRVRRHWRKGSSHVLQRSTVSCQSCSLPVPTLQTKPHKYAQEKVPDTEDSVPPEAQDLER